MKILIAFSLLCTAVTVWCYYDYFKNRERWDKEIFACERTKVGGGFRSWVFKIVFFNLLWQLIFHLAIFVVLVSPLAFFSVVLIESLDAYLSDDTVYVFAYVIALVAVVHAMMILFVFWKRADPARLYIQNDALIFKDFYVKELGRVNLKKSFEYQLFRLEKHVWHHIKGPNVYYSFSYVFRQNGKQFVLNIGDYQQYKKIAARRDVPRKSDLTYDSYSIGGWTDDEWLVDYLRPFLRRNKKAELLRD